MVDTLEKKSCTEVIEILQHISEIDYKKIPQEIINTLNNNKDENYYFEYDVHKTLDEQNVSKQTKIIIALFFRDYWATQHQREVILEYEKNYRNRKEEEKKEKYNPNELFKKSKNFSNGNVEENSLVEIKEEKWYKKIFLVIKNFFRKHI